MKSIIITSLLAAAALAAPEFKTTTKAAAHTPPICTFDPVKGEYVCPEGERHRVPAIKIDTAERDITERATTAQGNVNAADCPKCQADWEKCLTHWGCWFYDCRPACRCQVVNNDSQCKECPAGECHA